MLVKHCYECHSRDAKEVGGKLLLDTRDGLRKGGESGPALVAGKPDESLIVQALRYDGLEMPPEKPLPEAVVNDVEEWIRRGAPIRAGRRRGAAAGRIDHRQRRGVWSLQPRAESAVAGGAE